MYVLEAKQLRSVRIARFAHNEAAGNAVRIPHDKVHGGAGAAARIKGCSSNVVRTIDELLWRYYLKSHSVECHAEARRQSVCQDEGPTGGKSAFSRKVMKIATGQSTIQTPLGFALAGCTRSQS